MSDEKKKKNYGPITVALFVAAAVMFWFALSGDDGDSQQAAQAEPEAEQAETAEETELEMIRRKLGDDVLYDGRFAPLARRVKNNMNNPDSFEHVESRYADDGDRVYILMTYRGENAYGATVTEQVEALVDYDSNEITYLAAVEE